MILALARNSRWPIVAGATRKAEAIVAAAYRDAHGLTDAQLAAETDAAVARISAGAPLVDVLNPEWLGAQQEFLAVRRFGAAPVLEREACGAGLFVHTRADRLADLARQAVERDRLILRESGPQEL
mgnify:CR=1 FL=1